MLAMAVPGTILGVGFIRGFVKGFFHTGWMQGFYNTIWIIIVVFIVRSLPIGTRSATASLRQIDKSIEESAFDMGANSFKVFTSVTLPLVRDSFFASIVTSFVRSVTAISAVILLVTPDYKLITYVINEFAGKAAYPTASAYSTVLMIVSGLTIGAMIFIRYESPKGEMRHRHLFNGGNGEGTVCLYRFENGKRILIDEIEAKNVGCEYGEYAED